MPFLLELSLGGNATSSEASENVTVFEVEFVEAAGSAASEGEVAAFLAAFEGETAASGAAFEGEEVEASVVGDEGCVVASSIMTSSSGLAAATGANTTASMDGQGMIAGGGSAPEAPLYLVGAAVFQKSVHATPNVLLIALQCPGAA